MGHSQLLWPTCHIAGMEKSVQCHTTALGLCSLWISQLQGTLQLLFPVPIQLQEAQRSQPCSEQGTQAHPQSLSRTLSPLLTFPPGPRGGKAQQAEHRTAPRLELFPAVFPQALAASSLNCSRTWEYLLWKFCTTSPRGQKQPTQVLSSTQQLAQSIFS